MAAVAQGRIEWMPATTRMVSSHNTRQPLRLWMLARSDQGQQMLQRVGSVDKIDNDTLSVDCTPEEFQNIETTSFQILRRKTTNEPLRMLHHV